MAKAPRLLQARISAYAFQQCSLYTPIAITEKLYIEQLKLELHPHSRTAAYQLQHSPTAASELLRMHKNYIKLHSLQSVIAVYVCKRV